MQKTNADGVHIHPIYGVLVGEVMGGAFSSLGVPLSFFRSSSDALLMACCCFWARLGTFGSGVALAAGGGFEQEQIEPAANRVIRIFLMSIFGCELGSERSRHQLPYRSRKRHRPGRLSTKRENENARHGDAARFRFKLL
jgi:hypothetical protein